MKEREVNGEARVLCWPGRLLSEDDLRRHLTCQSEILLTLKTVVTPLALDHLRDKGVRIRREDAPANGRAGSVSDRSAWSYAQDSNDALVTATLAALQREGIKLVALPGTTPLQWARAVAESTTPGAVIFCTNAGLVCCVANKVPGVRGIAAMTAAQVKRAKESFGPNLFAVETVGRTFHELRQIVRAAVGPTSCPADVVKVLQELDGHAHR